MKNWKTSLYVQIILMLGMGLGLSLAPQTLANLIHLGSVNEIWVRVTGLVAFVLCLYYYTAIKHNAAWFARVSCTGRYFFTACLALTGYLYQLPVFIVMAILEASLAIWTQWSLSNGGDLQS